MYGSSICSMLPSGGSLAGLSIMNTLAAGGRDAVGDGRRGGDQRQAELALEALAHDLHVQQAEKAAAEAEAERERALRLVAERRVVQPQLLHRVAQRLVLASMSVG